MSFAKAMSTVLFQEVGDYLVRRTNFVVAGLRFAHMLLSAYIQIVSGNFSVIA